MKKNILKKISIGLLSAAMMVSMTACNTKIKVNYDYKAEDYVTVSYTHLTLPTKLEV